VGSGKIPSRLTQTRALDPIRRAYVVDTVSDVDWRMLLGDASLANRDTGLGGSHVNSPCGRFSRHCRWFGRGQRMGRGTIGAAETPRELDEHPTRESAMTRLIFGAAVTAVAVTASMFAAMTPASAGTVLVVDDDGQQCGAGAYPTIAAAVAAAADEDVIRVCPGLYPTATPIDVSKSVSIVGPVDAVNELYCFAPEPAPPLTPAPPRLDDLDLTRVAVVQPDVWTSTATEPLLNLDADGIEVAGLVIQGLVDRAPGDNIVTPAVRTSDDHSGYRLHDNMIRSNTFGVEFGSKALPRTEDEVDARLEGAWFDHNCLRDNRWGLANQGEQLADGIIENNASFRTEVFTYEIGWPLNGTSHVTLRDNTSTSDNIMVYLENSVAPLLVDNTVNAPRTRGFEIWGGNDQVQVRDNVITGGAVQPTNQTGIALRGPSAAVPARSTGVVIESNTITGMRTSIGGGAGICVNPGTATGVTVVDNILIGNGAGMAILDRNINNLITGNIANGNVAYGIRITGTSSAGNTFVDNRMFGNGIEDAEDLTDPVTSDGIQLLSIWTGNRCDNDSPAGLICGLD